MTITNITPIKNPEENKRLNKVYLQMQSLINALNQKEIPEAIQELINADIDSINSFEGNDKELRKHIKKVRTKTLKLVEKELELVAINHYRDLWMAIGIAFGVALSASFDNNGLGLIIGLVVGMALGSNMDKKAAKNGKQLNLQTQC